MSKHHHKVKTHHWRQGILHTAEQVFESLEKAMQYVLHAGGHSVKVYNENDQLIHQTSGQSSDTYA